MKIIEITNQIDSYRFYRFNHTGLFLWDWDLDFMEWWFDPTRTDIEHIECFEQARLATMLEF